MAVLASAARRPIRFADGRLRAGGVGGSGSSGGGSGSGGGSSAVPLYALPASIALGLKPHGATDSLPVHNSWPAFAKGHLPAGSHLVASAGGQSVQVQQDAETYWPDGSVRAARIAFRSPVNLQADIETLFAVTPTSGAPNRTALVTPSALVAAKDVTLKSYGGDAAGVVYVTSLREIVTNGPRDNWGVNPIQGWDVPVSGPTEVMVRGWRMLHDSSQALSTGYHGWVRAWIYLSYRVNGTFEGWARVEAGNWDFAVANAAVTLGGSSWSSMVLQHELYDGATRIGAWGGPNDVRTTTVAASTFNTGANTFTLPPGFSAAQGVRFAAASGGALPGGLTAGTTYWLGGDGRLWTTRNASTNTPNSTGTQVTFGTAGSGNVIVTPMVGVFNGNANTLVGTDGLPIRIGGTRVDTGAAWDEEYTSRGAKLFPRYDQSFTRYPSNASSAPPQLYYPNIMPWGAFLNTTGDNPGDNRIGLINHCALLSLLVPHDAAFAQQARVQAAGWSDQCIWWSDPRSGRPLAIGNGPDDAGSTFPGMGPNRPDAKMNGYSDNWCGGSRTAGYYDGYSSAPMEPSHMPTPWPVPAHLTGSFAFADQGIGQTFAAEMYANPNTYGAYGRDYHNVLGMVQQVRGAGWLLNCAGFAEIFTPTARPEAAVLTHILDTTAAFYVDILPALPAANKAVGIVYPASIPAGSGDDDAAGFFYDIWNINVAMQAWRGNRAQWKTLLQTTANLVVGLVNDASPTGGTGYVSSGNYHPLFSDGAGGVRTIRQVLHGYERFLTDPPYPATGMLPSSVNGNGTFLVPSWAPYKTTDYAAIKLALLGLLKSVGVVSTNGDDAGVVHDLLRTRLSTPPCTGLEWSTGGSDIFVLGAHAFPAWAMVAG